MRKKGYKGVKCTKRNVPPSTKPVNKPIAKNHLPKTFFSPCSVAIKFILNRQTFLSCLFLFFLSFFLSVPEPKGDYHHPPVSCTTIYKLLKTYRLHNAISVRYTEPKDRLKKCEILSICRKIRLFEDVFYFALALSLCFLLVFPFAFCMEKKAKKQEPCCYT